MKNNISQDHLALLTSLTCVLALLAHAAKATELTQGGTVVPNATTSPLSGSVILANTGIERFNVASGGNSMVGSAQAWVVNNFAGNPFGASALTFVYQVALNGGMTITSTPPIVISLTGSSFAATSTDVAYNTATNPAPFNVTRGGLGDSVTFNFGGILVGQTSALVFVNTNATSFRSGILTVNGPLAANLAGFAPVALQVNPTTGAVPENGASSGALLALGLMTIAVARSRIATLSIR